MRNLKNIASLTGLALAAGLICGCSSAKRIDSAQVPQEGPTGQTSKVSLTKSSHYLVQRHDCLWEIAGKPGIYGDSFDWPMLFKANRDEIKDPDLIYPRQDLQVQRGLTLEEKNYARQMAMATPKYVPHSKPRETLPLNYF